MSETKKGTTYYSSLTEGSRETSLANAGKTTYTAELTGDNTLTYACDYEFSVSTSGTAIGQESLKDVEVIFEGDIEEALELTSANQTVSGTWYGIKGSDATRTFNAYLQLTNTDDVQNDIAGTDLSVEITNTNWNCYLSEVEELKGEAYALYTADNSTLTFVRSETPYEVGGTYNDQTITNVYTGFETETYTYSTVPWLNERSNITNVTFDGVIRPVSTAYWFYSMNLDTFNVTNLDMSNVIGGAYMFKGATINTAIDLSGWDVSKLTDVREMFSYTTLTNANLSSWNLESATSLYLMFADAIFTNVNISNWNTSNVTDMSWLFAEFKNNAKLTNVNVSNWDTSRVTNMSSMFLTATINSITGLNTWNTSSVTDMSWMFGSATLNVDLNLSGWNVNITEPANFSTNISGTGTLTPPTWKTA